MNRTVISACIAIATVAGAASAQSFTEHFDGSSLLPSGWSSVNDSPAGPGSAPNWEQTPGSALNNWLPQAGTGYAAVGYNATVGANQMSVYLVSPQITMNNGDTISFWTRTWSTVFFPDRMSVVFNTDGTNQPTSFGNTLLTINPDQTSSGYPTAWTQYTVAVSGLAGPTAGRFAFWYNPTDAGPLGTHSDRISIDEVQYSAAPAPGSVALLGIGGLLIGRRRRR